MTKWWTPAELDTKLKTAAMKVDVGANWKHKKSGADYCAVGIGLLESDMSIMVTYCTITTPHIFWIRPLDQFLERFKKC